MYRDDVCAVCGESLPPDHFYCRVHGQEVDERLHEIGALLGRIRGDISDLARLLGEIAPETWDYLAEQQPDDPLWPPLPRINVRAEPEAVNVDIDSEPGFVRAELAVSLESALAAVARGLQDADMERFAQACATALGADATH